MPANSPQSGKSGRRPPFAFLAMLMLMLGYFAWVKIYGTGHESSGWQHFRHAWMEKIQLGPADQPPPGEQQIADALKSTPTPWPEDPTLIAADFSKGDREFYLFLRGSESDSWHVVGEPKSDYEKLKKIWLVELSLALPDDYLLLGATSQSDESRLSERAEFTQLPTNLKYTKIFVVRAKAE